MANATSNSNLNNIFVWVPSAKVAAFRDGEGQPNNEPIGSQAAYKSKIAFLESTGEIMTQGVVFALNKTSDITALQNLIGNESFDGDISATTIIGFLNELKGLIDDNAEAIGDSSSGLTKRVGDLESTVNTATTGLSDRMTAAETALNTLNGNANTQGSVAHAVSEAVASIVDNADTDFDTLREIAAWIQGESGNAAAFDAATRIQSLETKVGEARGADELYTAEEAAAYNTEHGLSSGDAGYKSEGDVKTPGSAPTGLYHSIADLQAQIDVITGNSGSGTSISDLIDSAIEDLDGTVTLQGTTLTQPVSVTKDTSIDVLGSVTVSEVDGVLVQNSSSYVVLQADAYGAAAHAYTTLLGSAGDASDGTAYTIHGVQNYAKALVDGKNVTANGDNNLIDATASNNNVSVGATQTLITAVGAATTALQTVTLQSTNSSYISITSESGSGSATQASASITPVIGSLSTNGATSTLTYTDGLASTRIVAEAINSVTLWETLPTE